MTCQELRLYFEDPLRPDAEFQVEAEHLVHCAECARFIETQRQLGIDLRRLREALPTFPEKLDADVLANYRWNEINRPAVPNPTTSRRRIAVLCMTGAIVAMVLVAVAVSSFRPRAATPTSRPQRSELTAMSRSVVNPTANLSSSAEIKRSHPAMGRRSALRPPTTLTLPLPNFRSLMYCDELSCGGVMDVIRVQLPSAGIGLEPASTGGGSTVIADVLVGPDGIARGIRIVE